MRRDEHTESTERNLTTAAEPREVYECPEITDLGTLNELTLSGTAPLSDTFGGASGGGS